MNEFQFCYWLMGDFELNKPIQFNKSRVENVRAHLALVTKREHTFCNWLEGATALNDSWDESQTAAVLKRLQAEFAKVIDPSYDKSLQSKLNDAHNPKASAKPGLEIMC